jgi:hypothetical protein
MVKQRDIPTDLTRLNSEQNTKRHIHGFSKSARSQCGEPQNQRDLEPSDDEFADRLVKGETADRSRVATKKAILAEFCVGRSKKKRRREQNESKAVTESRSA